MAAIAVVTGASGFIASELVKQLLEKGYTVRGTVRSKSNTEKVAHLKALGEALPGTLELFEADLLKEGTFDDVVHGADYVFHTASPFLNESEVADGQKELIEPALLGTRNVLGSVVKNKESVKRTVVTSSFAAVVKQKAGPSKPPRYTEADWNDESTVDNSPYRASKAYAEKEAWSIAKKENLDLAVINPTFVIGPILSARTDATSIRRVKELLEGRDYSILGWLCDVRDIAAAHVLAIENDAAKGHRFIVSQSDTVPNKVLTDALQKHFPHYQIKPGKDEKSNPVLDNSAALQKLGLGKLRKPEESIVDMARTLIALGVAKPKTN